MGTRRYREIKSAAVTGSGKLIVPGGGPGGSDYVVVPTSTPLYVSGWMSDATNFPPFPNGENDVGCQMSSYKTLYESSGVGPFNVQGLARRYEGSLRAIAWGQGSFTGSGAGTASFSDPLSLYAAGATAVSRTIPTHPVAGAAVALAELRREGIPRVPAAATVKLALEQRKLLKRGFRNRSVGSTRPSDVGDEYLNFEFGWKPIVSDLRKFALGIRQAHTIADQMHRDSGRNVRRRYEFPVTSDTTLMYEGVPNWTPYMAGDMGNLDVWMMGDGPSYYKGVAENTRKRTFAGCYTYYVPPADTFFGKSRQFEAYANKILGTRLTPEVVWNLAPWSWAADWFTNIGDVATNFSYFGQDGLAMRYGYITETNTVVYRSRYVGKVNLVGAPNTQIDIGETIGSRTIQRRYASPWGFGLTVEAFTPRQTAITVALGLTQGNRV